MEIFSIPIILLMFAGWHYRERVIKKIKYMEVPIEIKWTFTVGAILFFVFLANANFIF